MTADSRSTPADLPPLLRRRLRIIALLTLVASIFFAAFRAVQPAEWAYFVASRSGVAVLVAEARRLGQYQLIRRIGAGGMGEVHLAEHMLLKQPVAIKLIRPDRAGDPEALGRFEREVRATARLTHWNTVHIYDYGFAADGTFYYAMEYLPGMTLEQIVQRFGAMPPARAIHFLRQVCAALAQAHAMHLVHRDVKPANVMVCERGGVYDVAKLLDFGLVRGGGAQAETLHDGHMVVGTPGYMSPEQARGQGDLAAPSDIYAIGATAYLLVTGEPAITPGHAVQMLVSQATEPLRTARHRRPDVPADLDAVIMRCLETDPARRLPTVAALDAALAACAAAGQWTAADAEAWWRAHPLDEPPGSADGRTTLSVGGATIGPARPAEV